MLRALLLKLLGPSWEGRLSAIVLTIAGLGMFAQDLGIPMDSKAGLLIAKISGGAALVAAIFGFTKSKSEHATTAPDGKSERVK